jgi:thiol peroxidase
MERNTTKMGGNSITLVGPELKIGDKAPDFTMRTTDLYQMSLDDYQGKIKLIFVSPSLDTSICDLVAKRFNKEAKALAGNVKVLSVSMDLPFALKRWAMATGPLAIELLSDYLDAAFGINYGVLIKELRLLNRAVFLIDSDNIIRHLEIVEENNNQPNYAQVFETLRRLA